MGKLRLEVTMYKKLKIGIIQTSLDYRSAWTHKGSTGWKDCVRMSLEEERHAIREIRQHLAFFGGSERQPDIVVLPELSVPVGFEWNLHKAAEKLESIIISGFDYEIKTSHPDPAVSNRALVIVPSKIRGKQIGLRTESRWVGKSYPAPGEERRLQGIRYGNVDFIKDPIVWVFLSSDLGNFAVAICYDFMDLDRLVMYRSKIQTLLVLAYNRDTNSFDHISEALGRMLFCNVVVCNCGYYGGSHAISPYREPYMRTIYRHSGQNLPNAQLIELPLADLAAYQKSGQNEKFKSLPPGFSHHIKLMKKKKTF